MLQVAIGRDHRQPIAYSVAHHSLVTRCSKPVTVAPLMLDTLPLTKTGLTPFTFSRWLVPWLMDYKGWALFLDADVLVLGDIAELFSLADENYAVQAVKNPKRFEWPSVMLWNCGHEANKTLTPEYVEGDGKPYKFDWLQGDEWVGALPSEWNHLVGYDEPRDDAKLVHFTAGIPPFEETACSEYADEWAKEHQRLSSAMPWIALMGQSVHAAALPDGRVLPHFHPEVLAARNGGV